MPTAKKAIKKKVEAKKVVLSKVSDTNLKKELERRGYRVSALWSVDYVRYVLQNLNSDFKTKHRLTDDECEAILDIAMGCDKYTDPFGESVYKTILLKFFPELI